jgi:hypothetical protein
MYKNIKNSKSLFWILLLLLLISIAIMRYLDSFLITLSSPNGIVSFELAKESNVSAEIINSWTETAKAAAGLSLGFDFLFLLIYASFISLLIIRINESFFYNENFKIIEKVMVTLPFLAAFFDIIENVALIKLLLGDIQNKWSLIASYSAMIKFGLLFILIVYILLGSVILIVKKLKK